jgi:hypothetical protein
MLKYIVVSQSMIVRIIQTEYQTPTTEDIAVISRGKRDKSLYHSKMF